jgi:hypothetical protein
LYCEKKRKKTQAPLSLQPGLVLYDYHRKIRLNGVNDVVTAKRNVK